MHRMVWLELTFFPTAVQFAFKSQKRWIQTARAHVIAIKIKNITQYTEHYDQSHAGSFVKILN